MVIEENVFLMYLLFCKTASLTFSAALSILLFFGTHSGFYRVVLQMFDIQSKFLKKYEMKTSRIPKFQIFETLFCKSKK